MPLDILSRIVQTKTEEIALAIQSEPLVDVRRRAEASLSGPSAVRGFLSTLRAKATVRQPAVIAELKRASPSRGVLRPLYNPTEIADGYCKNGAACLSVLTDETYFQGSLEDLQEVRGVCPLPLLRKDFVIHPYQVYQARVHGADCILLIVAALEDAALRDLYSLAISLRMDVLVEVHSAAELRRALQLPLSLLGINNRNLQTFSVSLQTTEDLLKEVPKGCFVVSESGISSREDVLRLTKLGVQAFLVGEAFMLSNDPGRSLRNLFPQDLH